MGPQPELEFCGPASSHDSVLQVSSKCFQAIFLSLLGSISLGLASFSVPYHALAVFEKNAYISLSEAKQ